MIIRSPEDFREDLLNVVKGWAMQQESSAIPFSPVPDAPAICAEEWL
jgi:hypothetical protein